MIRFFVALVILLIPGFVIGQTDDFTVRLFTGTDVTPPTTPVIQSVTPVSSNQIDVVWGAVTDDVLVSGYRVFRDGVQIATTTQTTFIDTGLSASTTYEYRVDAFDIVFNFSSSSLPVATTTLPVFIPPPVATSTPTSSAPIATQVLRLDSLRIEALVTSATLSLTTSIPSVYTLRFGRSSQYELGTVSNSIFRTDHVSELTNLEPGTRYYVEVTVRGPRGGVQTMRDSFVTKPALSTDTPLSVSNASVSVVESTATIRWENPEPLSGIVRIVRNYLFFPQHINDGVVVYEGTGESFTDREVLKERSPYYYTIFVVAPDGRVSAGVVVQADRLRNEISTTTTVLPPPIVPDVSDPFEEGGSSLNPSDIFFTFADTTVPLASITALPVRTPVLITIPRAALPTNLKSVLVTVENPVNNNEVTVYLLKLSQDEQYYEARFVTSAIEGEGRITVALYDFEAALVHRIIKRVRYEGSIYPLYDVLSVPLGTTTITLFGGGLLLFLLMLFAWQARRLA